MDEEDGDGEEEICCLRLGSVERRTSGRASTSCIVVILDVIIIGVDSVCGIARGDHEEERGEEEAGEEQSGGRGGTTAGGAAL